MLLMFDAAAGLAEDGAPLLSFYTIPTSISGHKYPITARQRGLRGRSFFGTAHGDAADADAAATDDDDDDDANFIETSLSRIHANLLDSEKRACA